LHNLAGNDQREGARVGEAHPLGLTQQSFPYSKKSFGGKPGPLTEPL
jgi:hypothetical protein